MTVETPLRKEHEAAGAMLGVWFGTLLPERFSDPAAEYRFAREAVALIDKNYRAWFRFTGPDRVRYLNALLTNNIKDLAPGQGIVSLLLNPQGHILAEVETLALPDSLLAASYAMIRQLLAETFEKFIIMDDVTLEDETERLGVLALEGPKTPAALAELCGVNLGSLPDLGHVETNVAGISCRVQRRSRGDLPGAQFLVERERLPALWAKLAESARGRGGGPIGYAALNVLRLEAGIPWFDYDFDDKVIPHEAALEATHISFTKGCYPGQEIVERVRSRGRTNRRRVNLIFSGETVPPAGTKLLAQGKESGHVTSAASSPAHGRAIGMGYLRREVNSVGSVVEWAAGTASVIELPLAARRAEDDKAR